MPGTTAATSSTQAASGNPFIGTTETSHGGGEANTETAEAPG